LDDLYRRSVSRSLPAGSDFPSGRGDTNGKMEPSEPAGSEREKAIEDFWPESAHGADKSYKKQVLSLMQDRLKTLSDLKNTSYFFEDPKPDMSLIENNKPLAKLAPKRRAELLHQAVAALEKSDFTPEAVQATLNQLLTTTGEKPRILFSLIRIYLTWEAFSPELNRTIVQLGKEMVVRRLNKLS